MLALARQVMAMIMRMGLFKKVVPGRFHRDARLTRQKFIKWK
jgi:hypothetical protein